MFLQLLFSVLSVSAPGQPLNIQPFCEVIVWEKPSVPNGEITGYNVMFSFVGADSVTMRVEGDNTHYAVTIPIQRGEIQIKVFFYYL